MFIKLFLIRYSGVRDQLASSNPHARAMASTAGPGGTLRKLGYRDHVGSLSPSATTPCDNSGFVAQILGTAGARSSINREVKILFDAAAFALKKS
jgi:hypothetical protein